MAGRIAAVIGGLIVPCGFLGGYFVKSWEDSQKLEKQRIEMQVQRRLGDEVTMRLQPEQVSSLLEERGRLVKEMARLEEVLAMEQHNENAAAAVAARASHK